VPILKGKNSGNAGSKSSNIYFFCHEEGMTRRRPALAEGVIVVGGAVPVNWNGNLPLEWSDPGMEGRENGGTRSYPLVHCRAFTLALDCTE